MAARAAAANAESAITAQLEQRTARQAREAALAEQAQKVKLEEPKDEPVARGPKTTSSSSATVESQVKAEPTGG